jgi:hypothetical protein
MLPAEVTESVNQAKVVPTSIDTHSSRDSALISSARLALLFLVIKLTSFLFTDILHFPKLSDVSKAKAKGFLALRQSKSITSSLFTITYYFKLCPLIAA